jgi:hypothetical protein
VLAGTSEGLRVVPCQAATLFGDTVFGVRSMAIVCMVAASGAMLFWLLCCLALAFVWKSGRGAWWYAAGAAMGLLLLSKYTGVFLFAGVARHASVVVEADSSQDAPASARSLKRWILPVAVFGNSLRNSIQRGYL